MLPNSLKSALLPFLASIPKRVGYLGEARVGLLTHRLKNPKDKPPMVAFYSALSGDKDGPGAGPAAAAALQPPHVDAALARASACSPASYYVFAPGAEYGPAKRWPAVHFAELARALDAPAVLLGPRKEEPVCPGHRAGRGRRAAASTWPARRPCCTRSR